jgi:diguanylate cyclase (GGDEF)-like protein/PAS domain S-box-containing protein
LSTIHLLPRDYLPMLPNKPRNEDTAMNGRPSKTLLSNLQGMAFRCRADADWTMEFASDGCLSLLGHTAGDLVRSRRVKYEDLILADGQAMRRATTAALTVAAPRYSIEYRILRADGAIRWVWERGTALFDDLGMVEFLEGFVQDITVRVEANTALREVERRFRALFDNAIEGIFQSTPEAGFLTVNPAFARMVGYESPHDLMFSVYDIDNQLYVDPLRRGEFVARMNQHGSVTNFESRVYRSDGEIIWISENARAVRNDKGRLMFFEGTVECITERKTYDAKIHFQATHDPLTGLPNRTLLYDRMEQAMLEAGNEGSMAALIVLDLDQFKYINDSLGHGVGDELLKAVAQRLRACVGTDDTVARQGGDEFVLILANQRDMLGITQTIHGVLQAVAEPWMTNGLELQITCSIGVSVFPADGHEVDVLLRNADSAMYKAKQLGRNTSQYFSEEMNTRVTDRLEMLTHLRRALVADEFMLHYQPKIQAQGGAMIGMEALIRWRRADGKMVSPANFIPLAEETGLILSIGEWTLQTACAQNVAWQRAGLPPMAVSVNLSPLQLERGNIVDVVARVLKNTGLDPSFLELEITESVVMQNVAQSLIVLRQLKDLGVKLSIDDFGTGYSSLSYLKQLPVDTLKIDQAFVRDIAIDSDDAAIVQAVISLGHILNLNVLAEGVETQEQYQFLMDNGCDEVQGYFFGRPSGPNVFAPYLEPSVKIKKIDLPDVVAAVGMAVARRR